MVNCRFCESANLEIFIDLGSSPPSNSYLEKADLLKSEEHFPLRVHVCQDCWLVQTQDFAKKEIFFNEKYAYFSSISTSWLQHAYEYSQKIIKALSLNSESFVVEVASNDGYLLQNFKENSIPCLGVEPTGSTADICQAKGIDVERKFFGELVSGEIVKKYRKADLVVCNNVYAHVPDIKDFTKGIKALLSKNGVVTIEFPHFMELLLRLQFDTIYHEHFSYLSLHVVKKIFESSGLKIFDVEKISTHGGSLRIYGCHSESEKPVLESVQKVLHSEVSNGLLELDSYLSFKNKVQKIKFDLIQYLILNKKEGKKISGYGAAAKGMTLLNYAHIGPDLIDCIYDAAPLKQGKYTPGMHIPIKDPNEINDDSPDIIIIFPWNISAEISTTLSKLSKKDLKMVQVKGCIEEGIIKSMIN